MFVQIHIVQSMPPGNLNRDDTGQPKKSLFGGVTRGRISSQCLKRNIRRSPQFREAFGDELADRTRYLPRMVADELQRHKLGVPDDEMEELKTAIAAKFRKETGKGEDKGSDDQEEPEADKTAKNKEKNDKDDTDKTGQLVYFQPPFARGIADLIAAFRKDHDDAYKQFLGRKKKPSRSKDEKKLNEAEIKRLYQDIFKASEDLTVDIGLFGRMTTSDLVVNVEAACQVAHAISTHETLIESDYLTAMDDRKDLYASTQTEQAGAAFLVTEETGAFFNSAVYYKYLNVDLDALKTHLPNLSDKDVAQVAAVLVSAAALANPTGKQNSFAAHGMPEFILVEMSKVKRPISYANAFLQPVEGGTGCNLLTESAKALCRYIDSVAKAFAPSDVRRLLLAVGAASSVELTTAHKSKPSLDKLVEGVASEAAA